MSLGPTAVILVDEDQSLVADIASRLQHAAMRVSAGSFEAMLAIGATPEAVLLFDPTTRDCGLRQLSQLVLAVPAPVLAFAQTVETESVIEAIACGARGYVAKGCSGPELSGHLEQVAQGRVSVDPTIAGQLVQRICEVRQLEPWPGYSWGLSRRQSGVLCLLVKGSTNRQIADDLVVGQETVKSHLHAIYRKLRVGNRREAIAFALDHRLTL